MISAKRSLVYTSFVASLAAARFSISDPSDIVGTTAWEADNALLADYTVPFIEVQGIANVAPNYYTATTASLSNTVLSVNANDTSVVVIGNDAQVNMSHVEIVKFGYSSNLLEASFYGVNAAVWVGNQSSSYISDTNITVHNGAGNIYVYGTDSVAYMDNVSLYSSGPVSHGIYAGGNGTVYANNVQAYSGGYRSSAFSGDNPAGYVHVTDAVAHTDGVGSAICYALGLCNMTNVIGYAARSPGMFMDSVQTAIWKNCDITAGLLAGMIMFGSMDRQAGATLRLENTKLTTLGSTMPSLWFGNTVASATIIASTFNNSASGIFAVANYSQVTQDFNYFAGYPDNPSLSPAIATILVEQTKFGGDLVAYNGSSINLTLSDHTSWSGKAYSGFGRAGFAINIDATSNWTVTGASILQNFTNANTANTNIISNGHSIYYNSSSQPNSWLGGKTYSLPGGGSLIPLGGCNSLGL